MRFGLFVSAAVAAFCLSGQAVAATYFSTQKIGNQTLQLSITTDNTQGVLNTNNLLSYTLTYGIYNLSGTGLSYQGGLYLTQGTPLLAEGDNLIFGGIRGGGLVLYANTGSSGFIVSSGLNNTGGYQSLIVDGNEIASTSQPSRYVLAAALPEPSTWSLMLVGFGAAGAMLRRRRQPAQVSVTYA